MKKKGTLKITLKSDLCASSGYAYAGIVDSDVCYDDHGLPYIPARRLKGCLRDAYDSLLFAKYQKDVVDIFGKPGADINESSAIIIDNAYIENYEKLTHGIQNGRQSGKDVAQYFNTEDILERFSSVIAQTKLEKGVADPMSLRFTRTINQFSPITGEELVFNATVTFDDARVSEAMLEDLAKATRHIGLKRNRGMGNVRCAFTASDNDQTAKSDYIEIETFDNGKTKISYAVENIAPLMISAEDEEASGDYIPGQQVLGMMASRYLKMPGNSADDETFKDLFLKGKQTVFSNLYPYKKNKIYYPAPSYICRLKKSKEYVYMLEQNLGEKEKMKDGNVPKNLRGKFLSFVGDDIDIYEVKKEIIYHHSHRNTHTIPEKDKDGNEREEGILYTGEAIRAGQSFAGHIIVDNQYAKVIEELLLEDDFYFGKSRSTQYGHCQLIRYQSGATEQNTVSFDAEEDVLVTLLSDVVLPENIFCEGKETIENKIAEELKIQVYHTPKEHIDQTEKAKTKSYMSLLVTGLITGYSGIWNLRKQPIPAIKAGSCIILKTASKFEAKQLLRIGERQNEGFGLVRVQHASDFSYVEPFKAKEYASNPKSTTKEEKELTGKLVEPIVLKHWMNRKINSTIGSNTIKNVSNSAAGRYKLMLMESIAKETDPEKRFADFAARIESIKSDGTKASGEKLLKLVGTKKEGKWQLGDEKLKLIDDAAFEVDQLKKMGLDERDIIADMKEKWHEFIMAVIVDRKLNGKAD